MAEFMPGLQFLRTPSYSSFPLLDMDPNMVDLFDHSQLSFFVHNNPVPGIPFSSETFHRELPLQPRNTTGVVQEPGGCGDGEDTDYNDKKRKKPLEFSQGSCSASANSSDPAKRRKHGKGRKIKGGDEEDREKMEVVHVRARRGQATDSHSLAERVRRGKIKERLKCLQDIVPGCYKTMGLAVMLDEIISYVHSLHNQVEFLSMKLTAASSSYDSSSGSDTIDAMQRAKAAKELETRLMRSQLEAQSTSTTSILQPTFHHHSL